MDLDSRGGAQTCLERTHSVRCTQRRRASAITHIHTNRNIEGKQEGEEERCDHEIIIQSERVPSGTPNSASRPHRQESNHEEDNGDGEKTATVPLEAMSACALRLHCLDF